MCVSDATLTIQKEVADRVVARPRSKDYGILSVLCQLYADCRLLFEIPPSAFTPEPKVQSSVLNMLLRTGPRYALPTEELFRTMVRAVFGKRRKTLRNSLRYLIGDTVADLESKVDLGRRPEELSLKELVRLSVLVSEMPAQRS
jgi:16S rRNA (adenine1518-N6/adenine1519-N6)-dimethyltransferase